MIYDVFISYSRRDMQVADEICRTIQSVGLTCFTDRSNIPPGANYVDYIRRSIKKSKIFLYIASKNSYESQWSHYELDLFLKEQNVQQLIVYIIDNHPISKDLRAEISQEAIRIRKTEYNNSDGGISDLDLSIQMSKIANEIKMYDDNDEIDIELNSAVFISHSHSDNVIASDIYNYLSQNGIKCWIDLHDIPPGLPYAQAIMEGLQSSDCLVVLYSKNVIKSHDMLDEIQEAHTTNKRIIPFLLDDTPMIGQFRYYLARRQWIKAYPEYSNHMTELINALRGNQERETMVLGSGESVDLVDTDYRNIQQGKEKSKILKCLKKYFQKMARGQVTDIKP